jgi:CDP-diacylglycerol--glycerol-3-phosphate 3-phosphatidyltransferase
MELCDYLLFLITQKNSGLKSKKENIYNLPNLLSFYRLVSVPILFYIAYTGQEKLFFYWFLFNISTDALDGFIARKFNMQTRFGAKLDSIADFAMYLLAMYAMIHLKWEALQIYQISFFLIIFYYLFIDIFSLIKFKEIASLHLISSKINGVVQSLFFVLLFTTGFSKQYYWFMFVLASYSFIENMYYLIKLDKMRSDLKGFFWKKI